MGNLSAAARAPSFICRASLRRVELQKDPVLKINFRRKSRQEEVSRCKPKLSLCRTTLIPFPRTAVGHLASFGR